MAGNIGGNGKRTQEASHTITSSNKDQKRHKWMSASKMVEEFGSAKATAKIKSGKLDSRPDEVTGLDDDEHREYKIIQDEFMEIEADDHQRRLKVEEDLDDKMAQEAEKSFKDTAQFMVGSVPKQQVTDEEVKVEQDEDEKEAQNNNPQEAGDNLIQVAEEEEDKTMEMLTKTHKTALRNCQEAIINLKEMFHATAGESKYCYEIHKDLEKMIPQYTDLEQSIESLVLKPPEKATGKCKQETEEGMEQPLVVLKVVAFKLDMMDKDYKGVREAYLKWFPEEKKGKRNKS